MDDRLYPLLLALVDRVEEIARTMATKDDIKAVREEIRACVTKEDAKAFVTKEDAKAFVTKEDAKAFATKDDLKAFATKDDLKAFATKDDLKAFATKDDLKAFATKDELRELATTLNGVAATQQVMVGRLEEQSRLLNSLIPVRIAAVGDTRPPR